MTEYVEMKRLEHPDGTLALEILKGDQGLFRFDLVKWYDNREDDGSQLYEGYWGPVQESGLYASADDAERDARAQFGWLAD